MNIKQRQIAQTTYEGNSVGRVFRKGSFWDKLWKGATAIAAVLVPVLGTAMAAIDKYTPERDDLPGGGGSGSGGSGSGGGRSPLLGEGSIKISPREFFAGVPKQNKNYNPPKVF